MNDILTFNVNLMIHMFFSVLWRKYTIFNKEFCDKFSRPICDCIKNEEIFMYLHLSDHLYFVFLGLGFYSLFIVN